MDHSNPLDWAEETLPDNTVDSNESRQLVSSGKLGGKRQVSVPIPSAFFILLDAPHHLAMI
jgi:hypothetical protein